MSDETLNCAAGEPMPGIYGKMPALGDFFTRRLSRALVERWDVWLQDCIACSREQLADDWMSMYLTAPIWRFVASAGLLDDGVTAGLVMPSVDRVGRYFPLTIMVAAPRDANPAALPLSAGDWFDRAETTLLQALDEGQRLDDFDALVMELGVPYDPGRGNGMSRATTGSDRLFPIPDGSPSAVYANFVDRDFRARFGRYSIWWSRGSEEIEPLFVVSEGLPKIAGFSAFLDGDWNRWGWADGGDAASPEYSSTGPDGLGSPGSV